MIVNYCSWAKVGILYDKPVPPSLRGDGKPRLTDELKDAYVFYDDEDHTLTVKDVRVGDGMANQHFTFARAKVKKLTPWEAKFEAYWWDSTGKMIRCDVLCTFEDRE